MIVVCGYCGRAFERYIRKDRPYKTHYCDRLCKDNAYRRDAHGANHPQYGKRRGETRTCKTCGKQFYAYPSYIGQGAHRADYCSHACKAPAISKALRGRTRTPEHSARISAAKKGVLHPEQHKPPVTITCLNCGQRAILTRAKRCPSHLAKRRFCSTDCWYDYIRKHPEAHGSYKGGYQPYYGPNWQHQAKLARERDNHTCQQCRHHQFNPRLDVHHIRAFRLFAGDYIAANSLGNLVSLCKSCHAQRKDTEPA